jgi:alpha-L-rhamnosidase
MGLRQGRWRPVEPGCLQRQDQAWDGCDDDGHKKGSLNHFAFGVVCEWLQRYVAGIEIDPDRPGYKHIIFDPRPGGGLTFARATYNSIHGMIVSDWKIDADAFRWTVAVPANSTATVRIPAADAALVTEGGRPAEEAEGVRFVGMADDRAVYAVGSGTYEFAVKEGN